MTALIFGSMSEKFKVRMLLTRTRQRSLTRNRRIDLPAPAGVIRRGQNANRLTIGPLESPDRSAHVPLLLFGIRDAVAEDSASSSASQVGYRLPREMTLDRSQRRSRWGVDCGDAPV
jgi:hypothetical protein